MTQKANIVPALPTPPAVQEYDRLPRSAYVRIGAVAALYSVSTATVWRWVKSGRLPEPVKLSPGVTAWNVGALRDHEVAA